MSDNCQAAFPAYFPKRIFWNRGADLRVSDDKGKTWKNAAASFPWGANWTEITAGAGLVWPTNLSIDPKDENRIFLTAATAPGTAQGGVYRTLDGGKTWSRVLNDADVAKTGAPGFDHFMCVAVFPDDPALVYAGTTSHGLWFSRDGGNTWRHYAAFPFHNAQSINFHPHEHRRLYVTTFGGGVWVGPHLPLSR
jgi:photosystem II stability/assembly factor-like uncharacterized protein